MKPCLAALFIVLWSAGAMAQTRRSTGPVLAITHVTVIDATGAPAKPDQTVVIADMIFQLRNDIETGQLNGPRIVAAGAMIDGPNPTAEGAMVASDAGEGRSAVQSLKKRGADFIRTTSRIRNGSRPW